MLRLKIAANELVEMLTPTQKKFVRIAFNIDVPAHLESDEAEVLSGADLQRIWNAGKERCDQAISELQSKLKGLGHPALDRIAEFGLNGITEGNQVALSKALFEFNASKGDDCRKAAQKLSEQATAYKSFI